MDMLLDRDDFSRNSESRIPFLRLSLMSRLDDAVPGMEQIDTIAPGDVGFVHIILRPPEQQGEKRRVQHYVDDALLDLLATSLHPEEELTIGHKKALYDAQVQSLVRNEIFSVIHTLRNPEKPWYFVPKSVVTQDNRGQDKHLTFFIAGANEGVDSHIYVCAMDTTPQEAVLIEAYSLIEHNLQELIGRLAYVDCCFLLDETNRVRAIAKKSTMTARIGRNFERLRLQVPALIQAKKAIGAVIDPDEENIFNEGYDELARGFRLSHISCGPSGEDTIVFLADLGDQTAGPKKHTGRLLAPTTARISTGIIKSDLRKAAEGVKEVLDARDGVVQHELDKALARLAYLQKIFTSIILQDVLELN